jgi:hypothetical protein
MIKHWNVLALVTLMLVSADEALAVGASKATLADWQERLPVLFAIVVVVLLVDLVFCVLAVINTRRQRQRHLELQPVLERE